MHLLAITVVCVLGQTLALPSMMTTMKPMMPGDHDGHDHTKPCCMPKRWQAVLLDLRSDTALQYATVYAYDADKMVEGSLTVRVDDETPVYQTFTDYNTMMTYNVPMYGAPSTHHCLAVTAAHEFYDHCFMGKNKTSMATIMPKLFAESNLGLMSRGIPFHAWSLKIGMMDIIMALSTDGCVPLVEMVSGTNMGKPVNSLFLFNDFSTNVTTAGLLDKPPACANN